MTTVGRALHLVRTMYDPDDEFDPDDFDDGIDTDDPDPGSEFDPANFEPDPDDGDPEDPDDDGEGDVDARGYCPLCGEEHENPDGDECPPEYAAHDQPIESRPYSATSFARQSRKQPVDETTAVDNVVSLFGGRVIDQTVTDHERTALVPSMGSWQSWIRSQNRCNRFTGGTHRTSSM
jgi:hypothetical protein